MKRLIALIISLCFYAVIAIPTSAQQFDYPSNKSKTYINEDEFYKEIKKDYKEFKDATYSVRRKLSYKEVPGAIMTFEKKTGGYMCQPKQQLSPAIHPERQVYFFASFVQTKDEEYWKYTAIDAETKRELEGGNSYHKYQNPYKK
ncbi:hypothetical protein [Cytobacillus sp. FSL R5-0596]|uniref:hypothetical protein n=1 Tax=Cytobacillus sp. FSL R5-0596 TaxID=2954696 RepID=UPI0030F4DD05